jgi:NADH:ubiquinone oxidoreductase subunit C
MYGINFIAKADSRVLLLDYLMLDAPMLKNYLCSGQTETQYNLLDDTVALVNNSVVEL